MNITDKIKELREELGWSQEELAHRAGLHPNTIGSYERGSRDPKYVYVEWVLDAMGYELVIKRKDK